MLALRTRIATALVAAAFMTALAPPAHAEDKFGDLVGAVQERHLANGMTVIVEEDHRAPVVSLVLRYDFDAPPPGSEGVSFVTTLLMLSRTEHVPSGEYLRSLARAGATGVTDNSGLLATTLAATVPANQLALPLWAWSDQMGFFDRAVDDAAVSGQRTRAATLRRTALDGQPLGRLDLFAAQELYPENHPYHSSIVTPEQVEHVDRAAVLAFHDAWITPDHATLSIVGDVRPEEALAMVERYFGTIPRSAGGGRQSREAAPPLPGETVVGVAANVPRAWVFIRWETPRLLTSEDARMDVAARLFVGLRTAWLVWNLVDKRKIAAKVEAHQRSSITGSTFEVRVEAAPGKSADELLAATEDALNEAGARRLTQAEVEGATYETLIDRVTAWERSATRASELTKYSALVGVPAYWSHDLARYENVSPGDIRDAIRSYLVPARRVVLLVTPTPTASVGGDRVSRRFNPAGSP